MALKEKLDLLNLGAEERKRVEDKFLVSLALVSTDELREIINYLSTQGVHISKAKEVKVICNSLDALSKNFDILGEVHETDIYRQDPNMLNKNVIDIYKKIKYCIQMGIAYKNEDGTYKGFLFSESAWQREFNKDSNMVVNSEPIAVEDKSLESDIVTVLPEDELDTLSFDSIEDISVASPSENSIDNLKDSQDFSEVIGETFEEPQYIDIKDYQSISEDMDNLEAKTTDFATIRAELQNQLAELDSLKSTGMDDVISFSDLEPESYGMGMSL